MSSEIEQQCPSGNSSITWMEPLDLGDSDASLDLLPQNWSSLKIILLKFYNS